MSVVVLCLGVVLTVVLVFAARTAFDSNEDRLLEQQTREAAAFLTAALPGIQTPLAASAEVAEQDSDDHLLFRRLMTPIVERGTPYVSASLWRTDSLEPVTAVGAEPLLSSQPSAVKREFLDRVTAAPGLSVIGLLDGETPRLGYAYTASVGPIRFVAYAEGALPAERTSVVPAGRAFSGLDNAIYLGDREVAASLLTASVSELPLSGRRASELVEFGDSTLLLVMSPTENLGGELLAMLPWLVGAVGAVTTVGAAALIERLLRRRDQADALAAENRHLYNSQLSVARTLQNSLLPQQLPVVDGVEFGARYVAGVAGLEIGGDWYDVIDLNDGRFLVIVGDVSGRGLDAGTSMASLRYAIRAFASQGDDPSTILTSLNRLLDVERDGHFATVLCATLSLAERTVTVANAGHPSPLLVDSETARYLATEIGPPIGVTLDAHYDTVTHSLPADAILLLFTDGLFERRGEPIDTGLERLRQSAIGHEDLDEMLETLTAHPNATEAHDDTAIVGARWTTNQMNRSH